MRSLRAHPVQFYFDLGLRVTINTDNRLVTDTTVSKELWLCHTQMGFTFDDLKQVILSGFKSAFLPFHVKQQYLRRVSEELNAFVHEQAAESSRSLMHAAVATSPLASPSLSPSSPPSATTTQMLAQASKPGQN